jgi:DNA repair exonuclease SbcCD ATPase subunit
LIWPSAKYELQAFKEKKDGSKAAKFSEVLTIGGKECSIGALSGGQQRALSLALDFAVRDVIDGHFGISMNPIILDEPFDGLDSVGREVVIHLLESLSVNRNIWVIDHASEAKAMFTDIIRVEKRNEITTVQA